MVARKYPEDLTALGTYEWQSDFARKYVGIGEEKGRMEEATQSLLRVLTSVGATVSDSARTRIENCTDLDTLHQWLDRAATVKDAEELFG